MVIDYCFNEKGFATLWGDYFPSNPASGRVMEKCGFVDTGEETICPNLILNEVVFAQLDGHVIPNPDIVFRATERYPDAMLATFLLNFLHDLRKETRRQQYHIAV